MKTETIQLLLKNTISRETKTASACCTPKSDGAACCTPGTSKEDNGGACCPQPTDGSPCCNK